MHDDEILDDGGRRLHPHARGRCDRAWRVDTGERLVNFWGYNPVAFAAVKAAFAASAREHGQNREFRDMVKAFHAAGIEVILDVVFNHTGEGDDRGRTYSYRGLDNELYYLLDDHGRYPAQASNSVAPFATSECTWCTITSVSVSEAKS